MSSSKIPYIIGTSPHYALMMSWSVLVGKSAHAPGQLSRNNQCEQRCQRGCSSHPFCEGRNGGPGVFHYICTDSWKFVHEPIHRQQHACTHIFMHVCTYIHIYLHANIHGHPHACLPTCIHILTNIYMHIHLCMPAFINICMHMYTHGCVHASLDACMHTYISTYLHVCNICVCMHSCMHA